MPPHFVSPSFVTLKQYAWESGVLHIKRIGVRRAHDTPAHIKRCVCDRANHSERDLALKCVANVPKRFVDVA